MNAHAKWESLVIGVLVLISGTAHGEIQELPDMDLSTAELAYQGPETLTLMITPDGTGGYHEGPIVVYVIYEALSQPPLALSFNSPDISGNGTVSLGDVAIFAGDFFGAYHFRSDLYRDGVINLSDVTPLAVWMGRGCE